LYRSLTGQLPWPAENLTQILKAHLHVQPRPLPPMDGLPAEVATMCERCLARDPDHRPSCDQVAEMLSYLLGAAPDLAQVSANTVRNRQCSSWPFRTYHLNGVTCRA
jgi:serine/threonine-protein kinase